MTLDKLLVIAAALFCCGLYTVMTRRNYATVSGVIFGSPPLSLQKTSRVSRSIPNSRNFARRVPMLRSMAASSP